MERTEPDEGNRALHIGNAAGNGVVRRVDKAEHLRAEARIGLHEIGEFVDSPVGMYSSGMRARLGFAVSTALEPDVLLLDEILATGDLAFRQRCFRQAVSPFILLPSWPRRF